MGNLCESLNCISLGIYMLISVFILPRTRLTHFNSLMAEIGLIMLSKLHPFEEDAVSYLCGCCCGFAWGQLSAEVG